MNREVNRRALVLLAFVTVGVFAAPAFSSVPIKIITVAGTLAPDANGSFNAFVGNPVLSQNGEVAFIGLLVGTAQGGANDFGIFKGSGGPLATIMRDGDSTPNGNGYFGGFFLNPVINAAGEVAFIGHLFGTAGGGNDDFAILKGSGGPLSTIMRDGDSTPNGNGIFNGFNENPLINSAGTVGFLGRLGFTTGGGADDFGIFTGNGTLPLNTIVRDGTPTPSPIGQFSGFAHRPVMNAAGEVAFAGIFQGTPKGPNDDVAIFRGSGSSLTTIAREGTPTPNGNGVIDAFFTGPSISQSGKVTFVARLGGTTGGGLDDFAIFSGDGTFLTTIMRDSDLTPNGDGRFGGYFGTPVISDNGQVVFLALLVGTSRGGADDFGVFRGDGGTLTTIARDGFGGPNGIGTVAGYFGNPDINASGQVAVGLVINDPSRGFVKVLAGYDDQAGLIELIRVGDPLLGSTIYDLFFLPTEAVGYADGINDRGEVVFSFTLADGRTGIGVTQIPEPGTAVGAIGASFMLSKRPYGRKRR